MKVPFSRPNADQAGRGVRLGRLILLLALPGLSFPVDAQDPATPTPEVTADNGYESISIEVAEGRRAMAAATNFDGFTKG